MTPTERRALADELDETAMRDDLYETPDGRCIARAAAALREPVIAVTRELVEGIDCALDHMTTDRYMTPCAIPAHIEAIRAMRAALETRPREPEMRRERAAAEA